MATQEACEDDVCPFCQIANKQTDTEILFSVSVEFSLSGILVVVAVVIINNNIIINIIIVKNNSIFNIIHIFCLQDHELLCFRDVKPGAVNHFLVVTRTHIDNCKMLQTQHIPLGEESCAM